MDGNRSKQNSLSSVFGEFLSQRTEEFKKNIISGLSIGFSRVLSVLVILMLLMIVLTVFAIGFIILLGDVIGSWSAAAFIVGGIYLIALVILFLMRKRLFLGMFINIFSGIVVSGKSGDGFKSLTLMFVRYLRERLE